MWPKKRKKKKKIENYQKMTHGKRNFYDKQFQNMATRYKIKETSEEAATTDSYLTTHSQGWRRFSN